MRIALLTLLAGCVHLPHVDPQPRSHQDRAVTAIRVESICGSDDEPWAQDSLGSGVVISERHAITALHVVDCPDFPDVHVRLSDGRIQRMVVTREDREHDIALLEISSADMFHLNVPPPSLSDGVNFGEPVCISLAWDGSESCGEYMGMNEVFRGTRKGSSGSGVYDDDGRLLGIVTRGTGYGVDDITIFAPVDRSWLIGT